MAFAYEPSCRQPRPNGKWVKGGSDSSGGSNTRWLCQGSWRLRVRGPLPSEASGCAVEISRASRAQAMRPRRNSTSYGRNKCKSCRRAGRAWG
eukprot:1693336-Alexandrium_andersonii.AAC.1